MPWHFRNLYNHPVVNSVLFWTKPSMKYLHLFHHYCIRYVYIITFAVETTVALLDHKLYSFYLYIFHSFSYAYLFLRIWVVSIFPTALNCSKQVLILCHKFHTGDEKMLQSDFCKNLTFLLLLLFYIWTFCATISTCFFWSHN